MFFKHLEYHETLEEPSMKMTKPEDNTYPYISSSHRECISVLHHTPLDEYLEYKDPKVHIPDEEREEIVIHTEVASPTLRLSVIDEQPNVLSVIVSFV